MHFGNHAKAGAAVKLPVNEAKPILAYGPVILADESRPVDLQVRVTAPSTGSSLPVILLAHGQGPSNWLSSFSGYAPLVEFWAQHGFTVMQPTHLSSAFLGLKAPEGNEVFWKERYLDMPRILDRLDEIEATVPGLKGRLDRDRIAIVGHSMGGSTTQLLLGASNTDPRDGSKWHKPESRIKAGIVMASVGKGGDDLSENGRRVLPFMNPDFSTMTTPALTIYGDQDNMNPHLTIRGEDWHADGYHLSPGSKDLLSIKGGKHGLGGISGWDAAETRDEGPQMLETVRRMTWAYLMSQLYEGDKSWDEAREAMKGLQELGTVESKR